MKHPTKHHDRGAKAAASGGLAPVDVISDEPGSDLQLRIREAAYYRYLARGEEAGHEVEDWLQAEAELVDTDKLSGPAN